MKQPQGGLFKQLTQMQQRVGAIQKELLAKTYEGTAANKLAKVRVGGDGQLLRVDLDESLKGEDMETLGDIVVAAYQDAFRQKEEFAKSKMGSIAGGLLPLGMKLPL